MTSSSTKIAKGLKLNQTSREAVRKAFADPMRDANDEILRKAKTALAREIYEAAYTKEELRAIKVLAQRGFTTASNYRYFNSIEKQDDKDRPVYQTLHVNLGDSTCQWVGNILEVPKALLDKYTELGQAHSAREKEITDLIRELNSVLLTAKTRPELVELWPPVEKLMGQQWVWAQAEPNNLPTVQTTRITAAFEAMQTA